MPTRPRRRQQRFAHCEPVVRSRSGHEGAASGLVQRLADCLRRVRLILAPPPPQRHAPPSAGHLPCCAGRDPADHNVALLRPGWAEEGGAAGRPGRGRRSGPAGRVKEGGTRLAVRMREQRPGRLEGAAGRPAGRRREARERPSQLDGSGGSGPAGWAEEERPRRRREERLGRLGGEGRSGPAG